MYFWKFTAWIPSVFGAKIDSLKIPGTVSLSLLLVEEHL